MTSSFAFRGKRQSNQGSKGRTGAPLAEIKGLGPRTIKALHKINIHTVEELARTSEEKLTSISGIGQKHAKALTRRATGYLRGNSEKETEVEHAPQAAEGEPEAQEEGMTDAEILNSALQMRLRRVARYKWPFRRKGKTNASAFSARTIGGYTFNLPSIPSHVSLAIRTIGEHTFHLPWVRPRFTGNSQVGAVVFKVQAFAQQVTAFLRNLDNRLAGGSERLKERVRIRRREVEAGLRPSERGILGCRRWPWWGWWLLDSAFCAVWLAVYFDFPKTPAMSLWFVLLAGGLPWVAVAAVGTGVGVIALAVYVPRALWKGRLQRAQSNAK
ncbi:MAG: helix-hairpin-helix domain-containing protein [Nitrospinota bacterium]